MSRCDVLITYCWNRVGYNILRSLSSKGLIVWAADTSSKNICTMSRYCAGSFVYPDPFTEERAFIDVLKKRIEELNPRVLLPTHDESIVIMRHRDEFPEELIIPYADSDMLLRLSSKSEATKLAGQAGVPIPYIYKVVDDVQRYPVVFKTAIGNSAKGVFFPKTKEELQGLVEKYQGTDYLIQEKIGGSDYSVDCVRWDGYYHSSVYKALVTKTEGGGTTTQREIVDEPVLEQYAKKLLDFVNFKGVCGIDFRYDPQTKQVAFIEVNARFTGGLATPIAAGFDIPWVVYTLATTGKCDDNQRAKIGVKTKWILGDVITFVGRLISLRISLSEMKQVFSFHGFDAYDDYYKDDKKAILGEMSYYLGKLVKNGKLNP